MTGTVVVAPHSDPIFRSGLRADLAPDLEVLGEAASVASAVALLATVNPKVVLLDVHLPDGTGADVITAAPGPRYLALSVSDSAEDVVGVIRAGARGYISKGSSGADVSAAVRAIAGGDAVFSPRLAGFVLDAFGAVSGERASSDEELDRLSAREQEVMRLIARGYAYKEVASELFISIKTHVSAVLRKLQLSSRHELTAWALERKLL